VRWPWQRPGNVPAPREDDPLSPRTEGGLQLRVFENGRDVTDLLTHIDVTLKDGFIIEANYDIDIGSGATRSARFVPE
jgi:hypothetical protein